jgi:hypothetical protein
LLHAVAPKKRLLPKSRHRLNPQAAKRRPKRRQLLPNQLLLKALLPKARAAAAKVRAAKVPAAELRGNSLRTRIHIVHDVKRRPAFLSPPRMHDKPSAPVLRLGALTFLTPSCTLSLGE